MLAMIYGTRSAKVQEGWRHSEVVEDPVHQSITANNGKACDDACAAMKKCVSVIEN